MDFKIETESGLGVMTFEKSETILNNIFLSLAIERGTFFQNPEFGMRPLHREKNTERVAVLAVEYAKEATQWIIDLGRATKIDFKIERDRLVVLDRLKMRVTAFQADGREVSFDTFLRVV